MLDIAFISDETAVLVAADRLVWVRRGGEVSETPLDELPRYTLRWRGGLYESLALAVDDAFYRLSFPWLREPEQELRLDGRVSVEHGKKGPRIRFEGSRFKWKRVVIAGSRDGGAPQTLRGVVVSRSGETYGVAAVYDGEEGRVLSAWAPMTMVSFSVHVETDPALVILSGTRLVILDRRGLLVGDISAGGLICIKTIRAGDGVFQADQIIGAGVAPDWTTACLTADGRLLYCRPGFEDAAFASFQVSIPKSARLARISPSLGWAAVVTDDGAMVMEIPRPTENIS